MGAAERMNREPVVLSPLPLSFAPAAPRPLDIGTAYAEDRARDLRWCAKAWDAYHDLRFGDDEAVWRHAKATVEARLAWVRAHPDPLWTVRHEAAMVELAIEDARKACAQPPVVSPPPVVVDRDAPFRCLRCRRTFDCTCGT